MTARKITKATAAVRIQPKLRVRGAEGGAVMLANRGLVRIHGIRRSANVAAMVEAAAMMNPPAAWGFYTSLGERKLWKGEMFG